MDQTKPHGEQTKQFIRDDCSRIIASTVNEVLAKLSIRQIVAGIAVLPAGQGVLLVDVVMRDLSADDTWALTVTTPKAMEEVDGGASDWSRKYEVFSISRCILRNLGFTVEQITSLSDEEMQALADGLHEYISKTVGNLLAEVRFMVRLSLAEKEEHA